MSRNASKVYKISFNFDVKVLKCPIQSVNYVLHMAQGNNLVINFSIIC